MSFKLMSIVISTSSQQAQSRSEDSNKLLHQLLECVQQCQKRYGGKTELATEFDSCVAGLCLTLEAVLLHGLRNKPIDVNQVSKFKHVSDIVSSSLHLSNDNLSFWQFVNKHLTKHEQERYSNLKHIWTDTGRGKAWIRSALNERSLERYFHALLSSSEILNTYYEDWALLCDDEKNSMLPNMAAGLGSILFAINIDKPELNSGSPSQRMDKLKSSTEPVIEAPLTEPSRDQVEQKKKRKVAKQVISFDEDDSILSSSVPSSRSSTSSDSTSVHDTSDKKTNAHIASENTHDTKKEKMKRMVSIETSGSREKYSTIVEGPLTPIQSNVGELTPVSIEMGASSESPDTSENLVEIPTDISAVLTAVENKNLEKVKQLQDEIDRMSKENGSLKLQLKKYIGAVQMLKDGDGSLQRALDGLHVDKQQPDYKNEAKTLEKMLCQVAEMHAEVMDFNVSLQQSLCDKNKLLERLKKELEELRGPMPTDDFLDESRGAVNVWIPSAFLTGSGSDAHHVYQIFLRAGCDEWNIYRRYAQFYALHSDLRKLDPAVSAFDFPPKKSIGKKDAALVEGRRKKLQIYLRKILSHWPELSHCNSRFLLEQHLAFFKDSKDDKNKKTTKSSAYSNQRSIPGNAGHYTGL